MKVNERAAKLPGLLPLVVLILLHLWLVTFAYKAPATFTEVDSYQYLDLAEGVRVAGRYSGLNEEGMDLLRPPGYPLFMLLGLTLGNGSLHLIPLFQMLLLFLTAGLLYLTGAELGSRKAGLIAAFIYLLNPNAAFWSLMLLSETLAAFCLVMSVWSIARFWKTGQIAWLLGSGLALSAGAITRPIILPLGFAIALMLAWLEWRRSRKIREALCASGLVVLALFALVLPWQLRNFVVHGQFTLSQVDQTTFQNWIVAKTLAQVEGITRDEAVVLIATSPQPMYYSFEVIMKHPAVFAREQLRGIVRTMLGAEYASWGLKIGGERVDNANMLSDLLDRRSPTGFIQSFWGQLQTPWFWAGLYALAFDFIMYGLGAVAIWKFFRRERQGIVFNLVSILILSLAFLLLSPVGAGDSRFRAPADPLLGLLAGLAFFTSESQA